MRVFALLCWYDENPGWLRDLVASVAPLCDGLVALDGRYDLYPAEHVNSPTSNTDALIQACDDHDLERVIRKARAPWASEVAKRTALFQLGLTYATAYDDWFFVIDGDELLTDVPADARRRLELTPCNVGHVTLWHWTDEEAGQWMQEGEHRALVRALPGLRCLGAHFIYVGEDRGRTVYLRGLYGHHQLEAAADFPDLRVQHRTLERDPKRHDTAWRYYERRDKQSAENILAMAD